MNESTVQVRDVMSAEVVTLGADDHLNFVSDFMRLGRIRHMPVVNGEEVVGIVSQRDLFRAGMSSVLGVRASSQREWLEKIRVRDVMTTPVVTVGSDRPLREAVDVMLKNKIGCVPVVDAGRLVGVLSETDCLALLARLLGPPASASV